MNGTVLNLELTFAEPVDMSALFMDIWSRNIGATYTYYEWIIDGGVGTIYGYAYGGYTPLATLQMTTPSPTTLALEVDIAVLNLPDPLWSMGFATGYCASSYFCDQFPDEWGDPFVTGLNTTRWATLDIRP